MRLTTLARRRSPLAAFRILLLILSLRLMMWRARRANARRAPRVDALSELLALNAPTRTTVGTRVAARLDSLIAAMFAPASPLTGSTAAPCTVSGGVVAPLYHVMWLRERATPRTVPVRIVPAPAEKRLPLTPLTRSLRGPAIAC